MYDLQELEAFVSVVRTGSLTASTLDLGLPKSTLSRRIRQLEENVGQPLLLRQSRKIVPNDAGRVFYRYCNDILELVVQGREALDELKAEVTGKLELRCHESFVRGWFSGVVESFMADHDDLRVAFTPRGTCRKRSRTVCVSGWARPVRQRCATRCSVCSNRVFSVARPISGSTASRLHRESLPITPGWICWVWQTPG